MTELTCPNCLKEGTETEIESLIADGGYYVYVCKKHKGVLGSGAYPYERLKETNFVQPGAKIIHPKDFLDIYGKTAKDTSGFFKGILTKENIPTKFFKNILEKEIPKESCPYCKNEILSPRFSISNFSKRPDWLECNKCGYKHYLKKDYNKKTIFSDLGSLIVAIMGFVVASAALGSFGGGEFQGNYWMFMIGSTFVVVLAFIAGHVLDKTKTSIRDISAIKKAVSGRYYSEEKGSAPNKPADAASKDQNAPATANKATVSPNYEGHTRFNPPENPEDENE